MVKLLANLIIDQDGQGMVEYGLIISLVILTVVGAVEVFGDGVESLYEDIKIILIAALT